MNEMMMSPSVPARRPGNCCSYHLPTKLRGESGEPSLGLGAGSGPARGALPSPAPASLRLQDAPGQRGGGGAGCPGPQAEPRGYCR